MDLVSVCFLSGTLLLCGVAAFFVGYAMGGDEVEQAQREASNAARRRQRAAKKLKHFVAGVDPSLFTGQSPKENQ